MVISPPRGKVRYKIPNQSPCIPHISPGCGGGGVRLISASVFAILKLNIFSANEKFTFMSGQPINSFLLLKLKIFSGKPKNFLGPMVPWSDTFSTPGYVPVRKLDKISYLVRERLYSFITHFITWCDI